MIELKLDKITNLVGGRVIPLDGFLPSYTFDILHVKIGQNIPVCHY